ncbi:MAG: ABC transporter permease [Mariprofundaceae bacterium]|nr:ABC transporter permease [Mariprofundaceae bacterium]
MDLSVIELPLADTLIKLFAAWLLLLGVAIWAWREKLDLGKHMLLASLRGLVQLLILAFILDYIFDIHSLAAQALLILAFCILAARTSASHHSQPTQAWLAASLGLAAACLVTLPWLAISGAVEADTRTLIPLGSMIAANGMNAVSLMYHRMNDTAAGIEGLRSAMIPPVDTLRVAGLVHMPGIFVGMVLAGAAPLAAATAQLIVLYMIIASSFTACMVSFLMLNHLRKAQA